MHSTDKLIANLTQNDIEAISNRVFKNKVTHSEKKNLAKKKKKNGSGDTCSNLELQNWYETLTTHVEKLPHTYITRFWTTLEYKKKHHILFCKVVYKLSV